MKKLTLIVMIVALVSTTAQLDAADCNFRYGDGNWSNADLWENGIPDASKSALMRRVATLDEDANCSSLDFGLTYSTEVGAVVVSANNTLTVGGAGNLIGYQAYITQSNGTIAFGGELNMSTREFDTSIDVSGGQLTAGDLSLGRQATGKVSVATLTQSGGAVSVARTYIARNTGSDGSKFSFSGGAFSGSGDFYLGSATSDGTLEIVGNAAGSSFNVTKFATSSTDNESTVRFKLDPNGATTVTCSSWWNLRSGITLDVDTLAGFSANLNDTFDVITSTGSTGADDSTLTNSSAAGYTFSKALVDADSDTVFETLRLTVIGVPSVEITAQDADADEEGPDTGTFRITRPIADPNSLTVYYDVSGTAEPNDYTENLTGSATIDANNTYVDITITPVDDAIEEGLETVILTLDPNYGYAVGIADSATVTIMDNDVVAVSIAATDADAAEQAQDPGNFRITRSEVTASSLTVDYSMSGTADANDYEENLTGSVTIDANEAYVDIVITPVDDANDEGSETVIMTVVPDMPNYFVVPPDNATVTIADNDNPQTATFTGSGNWSDEAKWDGGSGTGGKPLAYDFVKLRGAATLDEDGAGATLDFGINYAVGPGDLVVDANNTLTVGGTAVLTQGSITQSDGTIAIGGELNISNHDYNTTVDVSGGQLTASVMTVGRPATGKVSVATLTQSGGTITTSGNTYIARNTGSDGSKLSFSGGAFSCSGDFTVGSATSDGTFEIVGNAAGSSLNLNKLATSSADNTSTVRFKLDPNGATPITCSGWWNLRSGITLEVDTLVGFSANLGDTFDVITSTASTGGDTSTLVNSSAAGYVFSKALVDTDGDPNTTFNNTLRLTVTVIPVTEITAQDADAAEAGPDTGTFRISRTGPTTGSETVYYTVSGTAEPNDYTEDLTGTVTIDANNTYVDITITPVDDAIAEGWETVILTLDPNHGYNIGDANSATVSILDNDMVAVSIVATDADAAEQSQDTGNFRITRSEVTASSLTVDYSVSGTAEPNDYEENLTGSVTIDPNVAYVDIVITPVDDANTEMDETVIMTIVPDLPNYFDGVPASGTVTIVDNDVPVVSITAQDASANEHGPDAGTLRITRFGTTVGALTVYYSLSGTADANDYTETLTGSVSIGSGNSYVDMTVTPVNDTEAELAETLIMTLEPNDPVNYSVGTPASGTVTITDDDVNVTYSQGERVVAIKCNDVDMTFRRPVVSDWSYAADASTYWVATDGNDSNPGTAALPFKTIQAGVDAAGTGNNVYIRAGTYTDGFVVENKGGTSGDPMIISCDPNASLGSVVVSPDANWYGFNENANSWVNHYPAIMLAPGAANGYVYINGLVVMGPKTWAPQAWWDSLLGGEDGPGPMKIGATGGNCRITNCVLLDAMHCGIKDGDDSAVLFEGNIIFNTGTDQWDHSVYFDKGDGTIINGNICFKSPGYGLNLFNSPLNLIVTRNITFDCDKSGILCAAGGSEFYHNTSWNNTERGFTFFGAKPQNSGAIVKNNIFANNGMAEFEWTSDDPNGDPSDPNYVAPVVDYNCYYPVEPDGPGANSVNADPKLVDPNGGDFRIYGLSPCVDAGEDLSAEFAAAGLPYLYYDPNKAGTAPDMGAFEYIPGDNNGDGKCNIDDYITLIGNYNSAGAMADGDTNGDGQVNIDDYIDVIGNYGYELGAAAAAPAGETVALGVSVSVAGNVASASITADTYGNTEYTYVWTATSATNTVYSYGGAIATFDIDEPGDYTITVTVFGNVGGQATAVYRYLVVE